MARLSWPPSPSVEDEETSLAREHGSDTSDSDTHNGKPPAVSRGSVDQVPMIIDLNAKEEPIWDKEKVLKKRSETATEATSGVEPQKPRPRQQVNGEKRFVFMPPPSSNNLSVPTNDARPRSKSTTRIEGDETPRGRPQMHRLQTDLGGDLHAMASGQRRAPSPYAYRPSANVHQSSNEDRAKASLLSPDSATAPKYADASSRRSRSAHPGRLNIAIESSDSDQQRSRHQHRSKTSRRRRDSKQPRSAAEEHRPERRSDRRDSYDRSRPSPLQLNEKDRSHRSTHGRITPPQAPSLPKESPYTSTAEESDRRRRRDKSREPGRRYSKESPYTSAAEDNYKRRNPDNRAEVPSRRQSTIKANRPYLDLSEQSERGRYDTNAPNTSRTPRALEDYFQKAFDDNRTRHLKHGSQYSAHPSPISSPPRSPPHTSRGDRRSRDYFELNAPTSPPKQRSRPPSAEANPVKPVATMLGVATLGASHHKAAPSLSRSSTASIETPTSGSQTSMPSGQRSRKPSPVHEEPKTASSGPISRAGSLAGREDMQAQRASTIPTPQDRPVSRAGSTASWEDSSHSPRASTFPMRDERPSSRLGIFAACGTEHPGMAQRAASYSSYDQQRTRPSSRRTYSTNGPATITSASTYHPNPGPSHLSRSYVASPISENGPAPPQPPAPPAAPEPRTPSFPKCPQPYPATGYHHWYTIQGMQNFDVCSSCASVLGKSAFRDYCTPSWKPPTESIICALSRPWMRLAVARALQEGSANVTLLQNLNMLPQGVLPCPGSQSDVRKWYHVTDPATKAPVTNFDVCTACVRSVELLHPELWRDKLFERPEGKLSQERTCSLNAGSKRFYAIFNELDRLAEYSRKKDLRQKDISKFAISVRQKTRFRECARDAMLGTTLWHYIPGLPEFTVCEECFEEVVWPMRDMPVAKDMIKTLQKVPVQRPDHYVAGISCQLYSERMRAIFKNACSWNDFDGFKQNAIMRYNVEHKLQEKHRILEQEARAGYDRREELEKNSALWKTYE